MTSHPTLRLRQKAPRSRLRANNEPGRPAELMQRSRQEPIRPLVARMPNRHERHPRISAQPSSPTLESRTRPEERQRLRGSPDLMRPRTLMHRSRVVERRPDVIDDAERIHIHPDRLQRVLQRRTRYGPTGTMPMRALPHQSLRPDQHLRRQRQCDFLAFLASGVSCRRSIQHYP